MRRAQECILAATLIATVLVPASDAQTRLFGVDVTTLIELDPATGAVIASMPITGNPPGTTGAMAYDPATDTLFLCSTNTDNLWTLDYTTGAITLVGPFNVGTAVIMHALEVDDTGQLYGHSLFAASGARFFRVDRNTGQATPISDPGLANNFGSLAFVPSTGTMYFGDTGGDQLYTIDRTTGAITLVGPFGAGTQISISMAYHPQLGMYAIDNWNTDSLWRLDLVTGQATHIADLATGNLISLAFVTPAAGASFCPGDGSGTACPCGTTARPARTRDASARWGAAASSSPAAIRA